MPAVKKDAPSQRQQDKESKRARGALSCAECRRLKLKCDKTVPCSSCKRRGCSAICPNGSLITGQGTRFVLADTEKLHQKIARMSDRIRLLEDALAILQSTTTSEPHPLLERELLKIKSSIELHAAIDGADADADVESISFGGAGGGGEGDGEREGEALEEYIDAFGTLAIREDGAATFYGRSAGSESLLVGEAPRQSESPSPMFQQGMTSIASALGPSVLRRQESLPSSSIASFTASFPFAPGAAATAGLDLPVLVESLPSYAEANRLCELYLAQAPWFFGAVTRTQVADELLPMWFPDDAPATAATTSRGGSPPPVGTAHDLALLFVLLCFGALWDVPFSAAVASRMDEFDHDGRPGTGAGAELGRRDSGHYYRLTKAALTLEPVLEGPPSVATVQTLALMAIWEGLVAGENSIESTWVIFGLSTKLAQSIGLHRDCARWGLKPAEVQKRRALFWELFITDCWQALATGRLPTFSLPFVDCELPQDVDEMMGEDGKSQASFPYWKARFGAECVSAVVQGTLTSRAPRYSIIVELDRKVRDMEFPKYAMGPPPEGLGLSQTMSHFMPTNYRHFTLLYIHRCFFAHAIQNYPNDPIKSPYAPSFLAGYRSACDLLASLRLQFNMFPTEIARFWVLWTHAFSSAIMLSSVVTHATQSKVARAALLELGKACELFEAAAQICPGSRAGKFVPILQRVSRRAVTVFEGACNGAPAPIPNNIFEPSRPDAPNDDLSIFSGKTHTLTTAKAKKSQTQLQPQGQGQGQGQSPFPASTSTSTRSTSDSPTQGFTDNPSFAGVHPSLVNELNVFDGTLNAQIQSAYYTNGMYSQQVFGHQQEQEQYRMSAHQVHPQYEQQIQEEYRRQQSEELRYRQQQQQQQVQVQHHGEYPYQTSHHPTYAENYSRSPAVVPSPISPTHPQHAPMHSNSRQAHHQQAQPPQPGRSQTSIPHAPEMPRILSHSQSHRSLRQPYDAARQDERAHHEQYGPPTGYNKHHPSPTMTDASPSSSHLNTPQVPSPEVMYLDESPARSPYQTLNSRYWYGERSGDYAEQSRGATPTAYDAQERLRQQHRVQLDQHQQQLRQINLQLDPQYDHYTPDAAMRGIAAEDPRLQEHWQAYMSKVASPRMIQDA